MRKLKLASKIPGFSFKLAVVRKMESREKIPTKRMVLIGDNKMLERECVYN